MGAKGYWTAFTIGVAAGAGVALLYAPQTGASTRKKIRNRFEDAGDYASDAGDYLRAQAERLSAEAQGSAERGRGQFGETGNAAAGFAQSAAKQIRSMV